MSGKILQPESDRLEFKSCGRGKLPDNVWMSISAFSNTDGGKILLGVDDSGQETGLLAKEIDSLQKDVVSLCRNGFNHRIIPVTSVEGKHVSVIINPLPAIMRPLYSKSRGVEHGTYIRVGSVNVKATNEDIMRFSAAAQGGAETFTYDVDYRSVLDEKKIQDYIDLLNSRNNNVYQRFSREEILQKQKVLIDGKVTLFGLLAFGDKLSLKEVVAPTMNIAVTQYPEADKVADDANLTYTDSREFDGCVIDQFEHAFAFIKSKLPVRGMIGPDGRRQDYLVMPEVAIREALANAIVHRDYATNSSRIQVDIYANRIEIINPGRSLMSIEELESTQSMTRNPLVMNFFKENGYTEQKARGIRTIKQTIREAGLQAPVFENISGQSFKATLFTSAFISADDKEWLRQFVDYKLKDRQLSCLVYLKHHNDSGINNGTYREINGMSSVGDDKMANRELVGMVNLGILGATGNGRYRKYHLKTV